MCILCRAGETAQVCCKSIGPLGFLHMVGISFSDTGQETVGCAVSRALIMQEIKWALVCLSVWGLSFYVYFGVHAVVFGWSGFLHLHGAQEYPDTPQSRNCCLVNPFLKTFFSSCWGCQLPCWAQSHTMGHISPSSETSPWRATLTESSTTQVRCAHIPVRPLVNVRAEKSPRADKGNAEVSQEEAEAGFWRMHQGWHSPTGTFFLYQICTPGTKGAAAFAPVPLLNVSPAFLCAAVKVQGELSHRWT